MNEETLKREIIDQWYNQYSVPLYKYILKITKDAYQAEDLIHDTFVKAYLNIDLELDIQYPKTWLYRIAHNLTVEYGI